MSTVHATPQPGGTGLTRCCAALVFDLPRTDRLSNDSTLVTCYAVERWCSACWGRGIDDDSTDGLCDDCAGWGHYDAVGNIWRDPPLCSPMSNCVGCEEERKFRRWTCPVLPFGEQVAIAVGNRLRIANGQFDAAMERLQPSTVLGELMQSLDDLEAYGQPYPTFAFERMMHAMRVIADVRHPHVIFPRVGSGS